MFLKAKPCSKLFFFDQHICKSRDGEPVVKIKFSQVLTVYLNVIDQKERRMCELASSERHGQGGNGSTNGGDSAESDVSRALGGVLGDAN